MVPRAPSLLQMSAVRRLALAVAACAVVWGAVAAALL